jgi:hypothetical protein
MADKLGTSGSLKKNLGAIAVIIGGVLVTMFAVTFPTVTLWWLIVGRWPWQ